MFSYQRFFGKELPKKYFSFQKMNRLSSVYREKRLINFNAFLLIKNLKNTLQPSANRRNR